LRQTESSPADRHWITEVIYGVTRRRRTLDALITHFGKKAADQQAPDLRRVLQIGFYQLCFLDRLATAVAVDTTVELARSVGLGSLTQVVNGVLRNYLRQAGEANRRPTLALLGATHLDPVEQCAILHSFPSWIVQLWWDQIGPTETAQLCAWFNHTPALDLRVNQWRTDLATVQGALALAGLESTPIKEVPGALRLANHAGDITQLPGFGEGWWSVQDSSAQQVVQLLDPQPGERILDCCAAPGGKTTHIAEQLHNEGEVWALDRHAGRLRRVEANAQRLQLTCLQTRVVDLAVEDEDWAHRDLPAWGSVDRVLLDAPCSGLGTLHRHADARWQQSPEQIHSLVDLQARLLDRVARWVKPGGILVYSTCTLHPQENQAQIDAFLARTPGWQVDGSPIQIYPHRQDRDGFFMAKLLRC
jgi:16S rRNA (cytosine967-C5)-methyltransferase